MNSIFYTVALLCQLNFGMKPADAETSKQKEMQCHAYYASCLLKTGIYTDWMLSRCIIEKQKD